MRARTDHRLVESVGASGEQPGNSAGEGHSLLVDHHVDVELTQGGQARHEQEEFRDGSSGEVWRQQSS
jgi:hypothetical protein